MSYRCQSRRDDTKVARTVPCGMCIAQRLSRQHLAVHRGDLVRKGIHFGCVDRQVRVEQVGQVNPVRLRREAEQIAIALEAPDTSGVDDFQPCFVLAIQDVIGDAPVGRLVDDIDAVRAEPYQFTSLAMTAVPL